MHRLAPLLMALVLLLAAGGHADARRAKTLAAVAVEDAERVVKVLELPQTPDFKAQGDKFFDLGYLKRGDGTGEWVGYVGSSSRYIPFGTDTLKLVMERAGLKELPPVPSDTAGAFGAFFDPRVLVGLLIAIVASIIGFVALRRRTPKVKIALPTPPAEAKPAAKGGPEWMAKAHASVNAAAPPLESPLIRAARERAERMRQKTPAVRGQIEKSPELLNRPDFGRLGGRR